MLHYTLKHRGLPPVNTVLPVITGKFIKNNLLTCSQGTWINNPTSYAYQWQANGANIPGANTNTLLLGPSLVGQIIGCTVTASNSRGQATVNAGVTSVISDTPPPTSVLQTLTLSSNFIAENSADGTPVGVFVNYTPGSTLSLVSDFGGRFKIDPATGVALMAGPTPLDFETQNSYNLQVVETLVGDPGSPKTSPITVAVTNVLEVTLNNLLGNFTIAENTATGTSVGFPTGYTSGSTKSLADDAGGRFLINSTTGEIMVANGTLLDYETAHAYNIVVRETHPDATNSPKDNPVTVNLTNVYEQPNLAVLTFSASSFTRGIPISGSIVGATAGSTITASGLPSGLTVNGAARSWAWDGTGSVTVGSFNLVETLADSANSPRTSAITYSIQNAPSTPTLTRTSTAGNIPVTMSWTDPSHSQGCFIHWEIVNTLTPSFNTDGTFVAPDQWGVTFVDGESYANLSVSLGFVDPPGPYSMHCRGMVDNAGGATTVNDPYTGAPTNYDAGPWSNVVSDTITVSSAVLSSATGNNKNNLITVASPFRSFIVNNIGNVGQCLASRMTIKAQNTKFHFEAKCDAIHSPSGLFFSGFDDGTVNFNPGSLPDSNLAGNSGGKAGITLKCSVGSGTATLMRNGTTANLTLSGGFANGDAIIWEVDQSLNQFKIYHYQASTGVATLRSTVTLSSQTLSTNFFGFIGGGYGTGSAVTGDAGTVNAGGQTWLMAPTAGYTLYG